MGLRWVSAMGIAEHDSHRRVKCPNRIRGKGRKVIYWLVVIDLFHYFVGFYKDGDDAAVMLNVIIG